MPGPDHASPQSLDSTGSSQEVPSATSPTGSMGSNSESTPVGSPGPSSHPPPSPRPSPSQSGSSEDRPPDPLGLSLKPNTFQLKGSTSNNPVPLVPTDFRDKFSKGLPVGSMPVAGSLLPPPQSLLPKPNFPGSDHPPPQSLRPTVTGSLKRPLPPPFRLSPSRPGPSRLGDRPPSFSVTHGKLTFTDNYPTLPHWMRPGVKQEKYSIMNSMDPEHILTEYWNNLLKGKIKPRMSGYDAVNSA